MASGSSGRPSSGSKGFDFASDDILCSYEDFANQESANGGHSDPSLGANSGKVFLKYLTFLDSFWVFFFFELMIPFVFWDF